MKVIIAGSTGMIGKLVLKHCIASDEVTEVISLVRNVSGEKHAKLKEVAVSDFTDYAALAASFQGVGAAFFCIGVYTGQVRDAEFRKITVDYALAFAKAVEQGSPQARLCLLSGAGADRTEKSRTPFARYKGMAENGIAKMNLQLYSFRPGYIYPVEARKEPNAMYTVIKWLYPLVKLFGRKYSITSTELADAMFNVGMHGAADQVLENDAILNQVHRNGQYKAASMN